MSRGSHRQPGLPWQHGSRRGKTSSAGGTYSDSLEGELLGFTYRAPDGAFAVARLRAEGVGETVVVGPIAHVQEGQHLALHGRWVDHTSFGRQFKIGRFLVEDPRTLKGLRRYLSSGAVKGLGPTFAQRVVDHFGHDTLRVIEEEPERLAEVAGIGPKRIESIVAHWERDRAHRELHAMLRGYGIGQALSARIVEEYGSEALNMVVRTPYRLAAEMRGVGFRTADLIARDQGIPLDDPARAEAAALHLLREAEGQGHCFLPLGELRTRAENVEVPGPVLDSAVPRLHDMGQVFLEAAADAAVAPVYLRRLAVAERRLATRLLALLRHGPKGPAPVVTDTEQRVGIELNEDQRRALRTALTEGLTVVTGGPGTGKTTLVKVLMAAAAQRGETWLLAAPTGRAARRLAEHTGAVAKTVHRLLEFHPATGRFQRGPTSPLEAHGVLVDEASMLDLKLAEQLVGALKAGTRLVLVGDADQLPSVGAGRVLADLISSGCLPVATLQEVYRQAADSGIVRNAHRINRGEAPVSGEREVDEGARADFYVVPRDHAREAHDTLLQVITRRLPALGFDPIRDVQVLCPMHSGILGTEALNLALQARLNPQSEGRKPADSDGGAAPRFRVGDRVLQVRNDYDRDIFNGDVGLVTAAGAGGLSVDFEGREVSVTGEGMRDLVLAYAISIHKSQGSEYPAVVVALHRAHRIMLRRNLLYTAITRARRFCCVVGDPWAIEQAIRTPGGADRWSRLSERLLVAAGSGGPV